MLEMPVPWVFRFCRYADQIINESCCRLFPNFALYGPDIAL